VNALPQDYGGSLPHLHILPDLLNHRLYPSSTRSRHHRTLSLPSPSTADTLTNRPLSLDLVAATHSPANPFFGYPVTPGSMHPRHGRRRKRDLFMTLTLLWWTRWKRTIVWWAVVASLLLVLRKRMWYSLVMRYKELLALAKKKSS